MSGRKLDDDFRPTTVANLGFRVPMVLAGDTETFVGEFGVDG
jgi:hypothetical protein